MTDRERKINELEFERLLWSKVGPVYSIRDGTPVFANAETVGSKLFPTLKVSGYNEANGCNEAYYLACFIPDPDGSFEDMIEDHEENGTTYAIAPSNILSSVVGTRIHNIDNELFSLRGV